MRAWLHERERGQQRPDLHTIADLIDAKTDPLLFKLLSAEYDKKDQGAAMQEHIYESLIEDGYVSMFEAA